MNYVINVSRNGHHVFATADQSCNVRNDYLDALKLITDKFTEDEGFVVDATYWTYSGRTQDIDSDLTDHAELEAKRDNIRKRT